METIYSLQIIDEMAHAAIYHQHNKVCILKRLMYTSIYVYIFKSLVFIVRMKFAIYQQINCAMTAK